MDILKEAVYRYGVTQQLDMTIEECGELITALSHHKRGRASKKEVVTEIADVQIMLDQLKLIFDKEEIDKEIEYKLNRLKKRLES